VRSDVESGREDGREKTGRKREDVGVERGAIGESRKIAIPDEMEFWYFIRRMHLANSNGKRTHGMRACPSITSRRLAHVCIYIYIHIYPEKL